MSADLSIHIFEGIDESDLDIFFSNAIGSKYCKPLFSKESEEAAKKKKDDDLYIKIGSTPEVWVGEVSWLKADLFDDADAFIPTPVQLVSELIGEDLPIIDDELINNIETALKLENKTSYRVAKPEDVVKFLRKHKGKRAFTVSW
jgi:hypothetical protein